MALSQAQVLIMRMLAAARGQPIEMPVLPGKNEDEVMEAIEGLQRRQFVRVVGPPNGNSLIGQDVDELHLKPFGVDYLAALRS
jgi:hypothetical protein